MLRLLFMLCFFISLPSYAFEIKPIKDNETIDVSISSKSLNRIFVTTDRIVETYGIEGSFKIEKDEEQGSIFIVPTGFYKNTPFNLYIKTEHGHHYAIHLKPADIDSKTIALKPLSPAKKQANRWEMSSPYENTLINLIKDMEANQLPDGYAVIPLGNTQPKENQSSLSFRLMTIYRGDHLEGQIWLVKNNNHHDVYLDQKHFMDDRVLAASFDRKILKQNEFSTLYWVKSHEA